MKYNFTNKFKVGDEVMCLKSQYKEAWIQPGDKGIVIKVDTNGYIVQKKGAAKNQWCFEIENHIDFSDTDKRSPASVKLVKVKRIPSPEDPKEGRLKLIKMRAKIWKKARERQRLIEELKNEPEEIVLNEP